MMFGFGDSLTPSPASLQLMEEMVIEYIVALVTKTMDVAASRRRDRPDVTDVKFAIRKDDRKMQRVRYLLDMQAHIQTVTKEGKNLTASYAEEAAAAAAAGRPPQRRQVGPRERQPGRPARPAVAAAVSNSLPGQLTRLRWRQGRRSPKVASPVGGSGRASALKPPPAPRSIALDPS
eukprot:TRINITY_DN3661_c0_g1_i2.p1 TRINITY_DN3661_c0_g1~~TRINITY_DN3661_c0_g1_i2.p1  ORF type:complete len:177 (-),score=49.01 TRINITY_DN3661_c0_g1_i2:15-545(-)